ncbi:MAG TPA: DUF5666 domain-containing protein [Deferrisomatales bacterium]|nr:DUF5666 domain-containing protein [Deferrisomatales bacterium]
MRTAKSGCWLAVFAVSLAIAGCGGGPTVADGGGGIGGTGVVAARGPITGFGSIWVNGIRFDVSGARVTVEGVTASGEDLDLGMVVAVSGMGAADGSVVADLVVYADNLEGPIDSIAGGEIRVLGQTVRLTARTQVRGGPLEPGNVIEVSGLTDAAGTIHATYVEKKADSMGPGDEIGLKGIARNVNPQEGTFEINGLTVSYAGTTASLAGEFVKVRGDQGVVGGILVAKEVELGGGGELPQDDGVRAELEGFVTSLDGVALFTLDGTPVDASQAEFTGGSPAELVVDARVEVEGTFQGGVLVAVQVAFEGAED